MSLVPETPCIFPYENHGNVIPFCSKSQYFSEGWGWCSIAVQEVCVCVCATQKPSLFHPCPYITLNPLILTTGPRPTNLQTKYRLNPHPQPSPSTPTLNPQPFAIDPLPFTLNPEPLIRNPELRTHPNPTPNTLTLGRAFLHQ